jgi:glucose 1-dehydrogenase
LALGKYGITVNTLSPGAVNITLPPNKRPVTNSVNRQGLEFKNFPPGGFLSGRIGSPADIGSYVVFLADKESQFITGSTIRADGGAMMN